MLEPLPSFYQTVTLAFLQVFPSLWQSQVRHGFSLE
jgi:hypothetical protein